MFRLLPHRVLLVGVLLLSGCGQRAQKTDPTRSRARDEWVQRKTSEKHWELRLALWGNADVQFYDGWYGVESDKSTGGAWRWMEKRSIVRLRSRPLDRPLADMQLVMHGWVPKLEDMDTRTSHIELAVDGHVLETFEPPQGTFEHTLFVPKELLANARFVDLAIRVANTAQPKGDWRDLAYCTTGFVWKPFER